MNKDLALCVPDEELAEKLQIPDFYSQHEEFFKALLTATQKELLGLYPEPNNPAPFIQQHASLIGKIEQLDWLLSCIEAMKHQDDDALENLSSISTAEVSKEELAVIANELLHS